MSRRSIQRNAISNLQWFTTDEEFEIFEELGFCSIVTSVPVAEGSARIFLDRYPQSNRSVRYFRALLWTVNTEAAAELLDTILWLRDTSPDLQDVGVDAGVTAHALFLAAESTGLPVFSHAEMLRRVRAEHNARQNGEASRRSRASSHLETSDA